MQAENKDVRLPGNLWDIHNRTIHREKTYLIDVVQRVVGHLVAMKAGVVSALPGHEDGERLDVLNRELENQRSGAELVGVEIQENQTLQFRRLLALEETVLYIADPDTVSSATATASYSTNQLLVVPQPFPKLLRLTAADQRILCGKRRET